MNTIITPHNPPFYTQPQKGDILRDTSQCLYLLCFFIEAGGVGKWVAMSLEYGHYWCSPRATAAEAAQGLTLYKRDATLTIS